MNSSIANAWVTYEASLKGAGASKRELRIMKVAFYAGTAACLGIVVRASTGTSLDVELVQALIAEAMAFADGMAPSR